MFFVATKPGSLMARPTQNRMFVERFRVNADERARLMADAAEAGMDKSDLIRHRQFNDKPLVTGKGMPRKQIRECLELVTALQGKLRGVDPDADKAMQRLSELTYSALQDDH